MNNFHTHTFRCHHGGGDFEDFIKVARSSQVGILGFTEHTALPDNRWLSVRFPVEELDEYSEALDRVKENHRDIRILKGMECDWATEYQFFYIEELLVKRSFDFLIGAVHWYPFNHDWLLVFDIRTRDQLSAYTQHLIKAMESGLYSFIAHPDMFGCSYHWDAHADLCAREIFEVAAELDIPLEINGNGYRKPRVFFDSGSRFMYPLPPFWRIAAEFNLRVICNSDAHFPEEVINGIDRGRQLARECGLHIIEQPEEFFKAKIPSFFYR